MSQPANSVKRALINKSNSTVLIVLAVTGALISFSVVSSMTLIKRMGYQNKVISARSSADKRLKDNVKAVDSIITSYTSFDGAAESVTGTKDKNSKIILDALPSKYDYPALATSLEYVATTSGMTGVVITGADQEATAEQSNSNPKPIEIPFSLTAQGTYDAQQTLVKNFERSIRPFRILSIDITANGSEVSSTINAVTYYQPQKNLDIRKETVK